MPLHFVKPVQIGKWYQQDFVTRNEDHKWVVTDEGSESLKLKPNPFDELRINLFMQGHTVRDLKNLETLRELKL